MKFSRGDRTDLVISMTLAETFLLLVFVVWYGVAPKVDPKTNPPDARIKLLEDENARLKAEERKLQAELSDIDRRLKWWRSHFPDLQIPGSEKELEDLRTELGRGKPACQPGNNLLADVSVLAGRVSVRVRALAPNLQQAMGSEGPLNLKPGTLLTNAKDVEGFLSGVAAYRRTLEGEAKECRFDYRLTWQDYKDYYDARERFDRYFYASVRARAGKGGGTR